MDLNDIDVPENALDSDIHLELRQKELVDIINLNIIKQYKEFENLGQNYLQMFNVDLYATDKERIFTDMLYYINNNFISIADIDNLDTNFERTLVVGNYVYEFICVDCKLSLIPAFLEMMGITTIDEFDQLINLKYLNSPAKFKNDLLQTTQITIDQLIKLQAISPIVKDDPNYQKMLGKYYYYQELIDYGDGEMFLNNYVRPVLNKYHSDIIWKLL